MKQLTILALFLAFCIHAEAQSLPAPASLLAPTRVIDATAYARLEQQNEALQKALDKKQALVLRIYSAIWNYIAEGDNEEIKTFCRNLLRYVEGK